MILIDSAFWSSVGLVLNTGNAEGNQYGFYNSIEMSNAVTVFNQYEFFKNSPVDGVYYDNQYDWYKAIGVLHSEPITDAYSFFKNVTFDGVNAVGNYVDFFKGLTSVITGDLLQGIFSSYSFINWWDSNELNISGTTTTYLDRGNEHDLPNPSATNQATYSASDAGFNGRPSLDYDGTTDYNYKSFNDFRGSDNSGVIHVTFKTPASFGVTQTIFAASDEATNAEKIMIYVDSAGDFTCLLNTAGGGNTRIRGIALSVNTEYTAYVGSTGAAFIMGINGATSGFSVDLGFNDGTWLNDATTLSNISIGGRINSSNNLYGSKIVQVGYEPYTSQAISNAANLEIKNVYGI